MNPIDTKALLDEIKKSKYKLQPWEKKFIKDCRKLCKEGKYITCRMSPILQAIYRKTQDNRGYQNRHGV